MKECISKNKFKIKKKQDVKMFFLCFSELFFVVFDFFKIDKLEMALAESLVAKEFVNVTILTWNKNVIKV